MTLVSNFLQMFACKLSSLGPGAELLPQATEIDAKSMKNRGCVAVAFLDRFLGAKRGVPTIFAGPILATIFDQNPKKGIKKGMQKSMSKKYRKLMPKVIKNDTKMDTKIDKFSNLSEKG